MIKLIQLTNRNGERFYLNAVSIRTIKESMDGGRAFTIIEMPENEVFCIETPDEVFHKAMEV